MQIDLSGREWMYNLLLPIRFKCLYGGRSSGKTWAIIEALLWHAYNRPTRIAVMRDKERSINQSAKKEFDIIIPFLGLSDFFHVEKSAIYGKNGSEIFFQGLELKKSAIKGLAQVDIVWIEEAEQITKGVMDDLLPTIRKEGSQVWLSLNPEDPQQEVYKRFCLNPSRRTYSREVNYYDLGPDSNGVARFPAEAEQERLRCQEHDPELYPHIWLGKPMAGGAANVVLPYDHLKVAIDLYRPEYAQGFIFAGLDFGIKIDKMAIALSRGPCIEYVENWAAEDLGDATSYAHNIIATKGAARSYFDSGGIGEGYPPLLTSLHPVRNYVAEPVYFGGAPSGADSEYSYKWTNAQQFRYKNAQIAWTLRLRLQATMRFASDPDRVDPSRCLFINPDIRIENEGYDEERYLAQMSQVVYQKIAGGKIDIDKGEPSPDMYDASALSFGADSEYGLNVWRYGNKKAA